MSQDFPQLVQPVDFNAIRSLTSFMQSEISSGTIYAPNFEIVRVSRLAARMYAPLGTRMTLGDHVRVTRTFADAFSGSAKVKWEDTVKDSGSWGSEHSIVDDDSGGSVLPSDSELTQARRNKLAKDLGVSSYMI
jgi:glycerol-3-phosphate O-acyltransferase / dihydroxyacetone phosphate acyltransferase